MALAAFNAGIFMTVLARELSISRQSFYLRTIGARRWRSGELVRLSELLDVSVDWLRGGDRV